ncbi:transposase [Salinibacter sp.]|uniref:transposase n=1 Tax=Salinibacter sp. TaxID=2065818 RepID=UPI003D6EC556
MSSRLPSNLTDAEWKQIRSIFDRFRFDERDPRDLLNAVFCVLKTGSQWRMLPSDYPLRRPCTTSKMAAVKPSSAALRPDSAGRPGSLLVRTQVPVPR